jgi:hypothetical protein
MAQVNLESAWATMARNFTKPHLGWVPCAAARSTLKSGVFFTRLRERWFLPQR